MSNFFDYPPGPVGWLGKAFDDDEESEGSELYDHVEYSYSCGTCDASIDEGDSECGACGEPVDWD